MDFLYLARRRYACRAYEATEVEKTKLDVILEAGRIAPTAANRQPQRVLVVASPEGMEKLGRCTRTFGAGLALVVCVCTDEAWMRPYDNRNVAETDAAIVTDHMMLAAASVGLDTLWICMFHPDRICHEFGLPAGVVPMNILLVGYRAGAPAPDDRHEVMRKLLEDTVVYETF